MADWKETPCIIGKGRYARQLWIKANGHIPYEVKVCHYCDNKYCRNLNHLFLGTQSQNVKDGWDRGRHPGIKRKDKTRLSFEVTRKALSLASKGRRHSEETKLAMSKARKEYWRKRKEDKTS